jgi:hypothetical protein
MRLDRSVVKGEGGCCAVLVRTPGTGDALKAGDGSVDDDQGPRSGSGWRVEARTSCLTKVGGLHGPPWAFGFSFFIARKNECDCQDRQQMARPCLSPDVPADVLRDQFDYLSNGDNDDATDGFFHYRDYWYHIGDFMAFTGEVEEPLRGWHGYSGDSYFSGVLIKLSKDGEQFKVGRYMS